MKLESKVQAHFTSIYVYVCVCVDILFCLWVFFALAVPVMVICYTTIRPGKKKYVIFIYTCMHGGRIEEKLNILA